MVVVRSGARREGGGCSGAEGGGAARRLLLLPLCCRCCRRRSAALRRLLRPDLGLPDHRGRQRRSHCLTLPSARIAATASSSSTSSCCCCWRGAGGAGRMRSNPPPSGARGGRRPQRAGAPSPPPGRWAAGGKGRRRAPLRSSWEDERAAARKRGDRLPPRAARAQPQRGSSRAPPPPTTPCWAPIGRAGRSREAGLGAETQRTAREAGEEKEGGRRCGGGWDGRRRAQVCMWGAAEGDMRMRARRRCRHPAHVAAHLHRESRARSAGVSLAPPPARVETPSVAGWSRRHEGPAEVPEGKYVCVCVWDRRSKDAAAPSSLTAWGGPAGPASASPVLPEGWPSDMAAAASALPPLAGIWLTAVQTLRSEGTEALSVTSSPLRWSGSTALEGHWAPASASTPATATRASGL